MSAEVGERVTPNDVKPSRTELVVCLLVCGLVMLGPIVYIQWEYTAYTDQHGEALEGAAGAGLALAVVFRTISRTVLRTIIRTSARAGMRTSLKSIFRSTLRVALRGSTASVFKRITDRLQGNPDTPQRSVKVRNYRSLIFASVLLYASWVIVIGFGQPYASLLTRANAEVAKEERVQAESEQMALLIKEAHEAWDAQQELLRLEDDYNEVRVQLKMERNIENRPELEEKINLLLLRQNAASRRLEDAKTASGDRVLDPNDTSLQDQDELLQDFGRIQDALFTYAPFPGQKVWSSSLIWAGGLVMVLPMWFIFFVQNLVARRQGNQIRHETGVDGGFIQLYFAGAFSFMPLTSDTIVDGADQTQRGQIALVGLIAPVALAIALWVCWRLTGEHALIFASDAFLIYPMVQIFPLNPLEGRHLWQHNRVQWTVLFVIIMFLFLLVGSEALRSVI